MSADDERRLTTFDVEERARELGYRLITIDVPEDPTKPVHAYATRHNSRGGGTFNVTAPTIAGCLAAICYPTLMRRLGTLGRPPRKR